MAWQNLAEFYSLVEFGRILWPSKVWQNLAEFYGLAEFGRIWQKRQITVGYSKLQSHTRFLFAGSVETGKYI